MTESAPSPVALPRPAAATRPGPLDEQFYDLVEARFRRIMRDNPTSGRTSASTPRTTAWATDRATPSSQEARRRARPSRRRRGHRPGRPVAGGRASSATSRSTTCAGASSTPRSLRLGAPLDRDGHDRRRRSSCSSRATSRRSPSAGLDRRPAGGRPGASTRAGPGPPCPRSGSGRSSSSSRPSRLPGLFDEIVAAGTGSSAGRRPAPPGAGRGGREDGRRRVHGVAARARSPKAVDDWALGSERYDELIGLRAFDGLDADDDPRDRRGAAGEHKAARVAAAREIDPTVDEPTVVDRIKGDHPATFEEALEAYRDVMVRARQHLIDHDIVDGPAGRADRRRRDARVPAQRHPVRGLLRAAEVRPEPVRASTSSRRPSNDPDRDARAQPQLDQQHQHPRGVPGPPPPAGGRRASTHR